MASVDFSPVSVSVAGNSATSVGPAIPIPQEVHGTTMHGTGAPAVADNPREHKLRQLHERAEARRMEMQQQVASQNNACQLVDEEMHMIVKRVEKSKAKKKEARQKLEVAFNIDAEEMKRLGHKAQKKSMTQLMFCFVIMGCELDFLGFFGAFMGYWDLEIFIVRALLVAMPCSFMLCIVLYFCYVQPRELAHEEKENRDVGDCKTMTQKAKNLLRRKNVRLSWFHFVPLTRYVLLIKSIAPEDVEGIFRVNSLSSFTLGSCQVVGLLFTFMENGYSFAGLSMFVYMNMLSQMVNWAITVLYFATKIAPNMKTSIASAAYAANLSAQMRKTLVQLQVSITEDAMSFARQEVNVIDCLDIGDDDCGIDSDDEGYLSKMKTELDLEVCFFKKAKVNFKYFDPIELLQIRRAVYTQFAEELDRCY